VPLVLWNGDRNWTLAQELGCPTTNAQEIEAKFAAAVEAIAATARD
jgi:hypothetical protein